MLRVSVDAYLVSVRVWSGVTHARLGSGRGLEIVNDDTVGYQGDVYEFTVTAGDEPVRSFGVQIEGGDEPVLRAEMWGAQRLIAADQKLHLFSADWRYTGSLDLHSRFDWFRPDPARDRLLTIGETSVTSIRPDGTMAWSFMADVITRLEWQEDTVVLHHIDRPAAVVRLEDGEWLNR